MAVFPIKYDHGTHCTGKTGKMVKKKIPVRENTGIWKFSQNTGDLVCSSCKFPDLKDISIFAAEIPKQILELDMSTKSVWYM